MLNQAMLLTAVILLICMVSSKLAGRIGIPVLALFIGIGMLFGSDGLMGIPMDNYRLAEKICTIALIVIMFYGGFSTNWKAAKPVAVPAVLLSTLGVAVTAAVTAVFCYFILGLELLESVLIGSVISSTDAASVFSIFRSKNLNLKGGLASMLEIESGSNDPMSYMLTSVALTMMAGRETGHVGLMILVQMAVGILIGALVGKGAIALLKQTEIIAEGLDSVFVVAMMLLSYALAAVLGGNGYLSVYIAGILLGNSKIAHKGTLVHFFDGVTRLAQIVVFFLLGILSFPSQIPDILGIAVPVALVLTFVSRPIAVFLLLGRKYGVKEKIFVSLAGLRGAASIVFAIFSIVSDAYMKLDVFHIVFCISLLSVIIQGTLLPYAAEKLDLIDETNDVRKTFNDYQEESSITMARFFVPEGHGWVNKCIQDVTFPSGSLALMVQRGDQTIVPRGDTVIRAGDDVILSLPAYEEKQEDEMSLREVVIDDTHKWCDRKIRELELPDEVLIALIKRGEESIVPKGKTEILSGDVVVMYDM